MGRSLVVIVFIVSALLISTIAAGQVRWLMHGTVTWHDGSPAGGVQLRLLQGGEERAVVYTNQDGRYGFFDVPGRPSDYSLEVRYRNALVREYRPQDLSDIPKGGRHNIRLPE